MTAYSCYAHSKENAHLVFYLLIMFHSKSRYDGIYTKAFLSQK